MAVHLVLLLAALVQESELEESAHVGAVAGEGDEDGDVERAVLGILAIRVKVDRPLVAPHREGFAGHVFSGPHTLRQRVSLDRVQMGAVHRLAHGFRNRNLRPPLGVSSRCAVAAVGVGLGHLSHRCWTL